MRQATASFFFGPWHAILDGEKHSLRLPELSGPASGEVDHEKEKIKKETYTHHTSVRRRLNNRWMGGAVREHIR